MSSNAACIFCKIIKGEIPCFKLFESERILAFMDINPLAKGHALVIPKTHSAKLLDVPDNELEEAMVSSILLLQRKIAKAIGCKDYNILQNNERIAHQEVDHVHFHVIPKPDDKQGLQIGWPQQKFEMDELKKIFEELKAKM